MSCYATIEGAIPDHFKVCAQWLLQRGGECSSWTRCFYYLPAHCGFRCGERGADGPIAPIILTYLVLSLMHFRLTTDSICSHFGLCSGERSAAA
eukprot:1160389-Pelagomonas_calceolata.AAC.2